MIAPNNVGFELGTIAVLDRRPGITVATRVAGQWVVPAQCPIVVRVADDVQFPCDRGAARPRGVLRRLRVPHRDSAPVYGDVGRVFGRG